MIIGGWGGGLVCAVLGLPAAAAASAGTGDEADDR